MKQSLDVQNKHVWDRANEAQDFSVFEAQKRGMVGHDEMQHRNLREQRDKRAVSDEEEEDDGEENKLAALNEMLKNKKFAIQREDEEDFEMFLKKLN